MSAEHTGSRESQRHVERFLKRLLDLVVGGLGLMLLLIPLLLIALLIKLDSKGPIFFLQERIGKREKPFSIWKFRTMVVGAVDHGLGVTVEKGDARITPIGNFLRNWGLDELPQLINVVLGEMSLVGPRPTLAYQVAQYDPEQKKRLWMKPGITSLAVVKGRNRLSWPERIAYDVWYVEHWSFWLDVKILVNTLWVVLVTRDGVYGEDGVNDDFNATKDDP